MSDLSKFSERKLTEKEVIIVAKIMTAISGALLDDSNEINEAKAEATTLMDNIIYNAQKIKEAIEKGVK